MNIKNLDTFIAVSKHSSINAAAEAMFISPPALQQQLNRLEAELGFKLFDRSHGGIRLTPAGTAFLEGAEKMHSAWDQLLTRCRDIESRNNCIRIGAISGLMPDLYPLISESFYQKYPHVIQKPVMKSEEQLFDDLDSGLLDAVEYYDCPKAHAAGRFFQPVLQEGRSCLMAPNHPLASRKELTLDDLRGQHIIVQRFERIPGFREYVEAHYPDIKLSEEGKMIDFYSMVRTFDDGHLSLVPPHLAGAFHPLKAVPLCLDMRWAVGFVCREPCSPVLHQFIEVAQQVLHAIEEGTKSFPFEPNRG